MDRLADDRANLRSALGWFEHDGETGAEVSLRMAAALAWFWHSRGPAREGDEWTERLLERRTGVAAAVRADALTGAALLAWTVGDYDRAAERVDEALDLGENRRSAGPRASTQLRCPRGECSVGTVPAELEANEEAVEIARAVGDPVWLGPQSRQPRPYPRTARRNGPGGGGA